jgi:hypothetical protein
MWPFKDTRKLARSENFPAVIDRVGDKLRSHGFKAEADRLRKLVHRMAWTTSSELYQELVTALKKIRKESSDLPADLAGEIRRLIKSINQRRVAGAEIQGGKPRNPPSRTTARLFDLSPGVTIPPLPQRGRQPSSPRRTCARRKRSSTYPTCLSRPACLASSIYRSATPCPCLA